MTERFICNCGFVTENENGVCYVCQPDRKQTRTICKFRDIYPGGVHCDTHGSGFCYHTKNNLVATILRDIKKKIEYKGEIRVVRWETIVRILDDEMFAPPARSTIKKGHNPLCPGSKRVKW